MKAQTNEILNQASTKNVEAKEKQKEKVRNCQIVLSDGSLFGTPHHPNTVDAVLPVSRHLYSQCFGSVHFRITN